MDKNIMNENAEITVTADELRDPRCLAEFIVKVLDSKKARDGQRQRLFRARLCGNLRKAG